MTKKQFAELIKALKGIEAALLALRVPNTVYITQPNPYVPPQPDTNPITPTWPGTWPQVTCGGTTKSPETFCQQANS